MPKKSKRHYLDDISANKPARKTASANKSKGSLKTGKPHAQRQPENEHNEFQRSPNPKRPTPEIQHMNIIATMFLCEALFAYYISHFNANQPHAQLWFINWQSEHLPNLIFTLACEAILLKWLYRIDQWFNQHD